MSDPNLLEPLTDLTELTAPIKTDMAYVVDDPAGTPLSKKLQFINMALALLWEDNVKLKFGTGEDAEIYFNGTDLIIKPDVVGSGVVKIQNTLDMGTDNVIDVGRMVVGGSTIDGSCLAEFISTVKGLGVMSMTTAQRDLIPAPKDGLQIYNSTTGTRQSWDAFSSGWV